MRDQFVKSIEKNFKKNKKIHLITGDLGFGYFKNFYQNENKQFLNIGISEQNMASVAAGMSMVNKNVIYIYSIGNFAFMRCLEQIRQDICYHNLNVNIISMGSGFSYGSLGGSHHLLEDLSIMRTIPNMKTFIPSSTKDIEQIINYTCKGKGPTYTRIDKSKIDKNLISKNNIFKPRIAIKGRDGYFISAGGIINDVISAIYFLKKKFNLSFGLIIVTTLFGDQISSIKEKLTKSRIICTVEEHSIVGGIGDFYLSLLNEKNIQVKKFIKIGVKNKSFTKISGNQEYLKKHNKLDSKNIVRRIVSELNV
mgnify:CR=1 FL=1